MYNKVLMDKLSKMPNTNNPVKKTYGFYHIALMGHWENIVSRQIEVVTNSETYSQTDKIYVTILGPLNIEINLPEKFEVFHRSENLKEFEFPTLQKLHHIASTENCYVYYFHTHGVSHQIIDESYINHYLKLLNDTLSKPNATKILLSEYDLYCMQVYSWYNNDGIVGQCITANWWWSTSDYISKLPPISYILQQCRWHSETWVRGMDKGFGKIKIYYEEGTLDEEHHSLIEYHKLGIKNARGE